jgi:8-oxo-dGTP pyrophosphatase MutT (NUDIX family)
MDPTDLDLDFTARREAWEEVGIEINREKVRKLCECRPILNRAGLLVTPIGMGDYSKVNLLPNVYAHC